jgi:hypothetical protein
MSISSAQPRPQIAKYRRHVAVGPSRAANSEVGRRRTSAPAPAGYYWFSEVHAAWSARRPAPLRLIREYHPDEASQLRALRLLLSSQPSEQAAPLRTAPEEGRESALGIDTGGDEGSDEPKEPTADATDASKRLFRPERGGPSSSRTIA